MSIQVLKPKFEIEECLEAVRECLEKGWTGMGFKTIQFEEAWKEYTGHKHAYYLNSNTVGLHLAVKILKMQNGWAEMRLSLRLSPLSPPIMQLCMRTFIPHLPM